MHESERFFLATWEADWTRDDVHEMMVAAGLARWVVEEVAAGVMQSLELTDAGRAALGAAREG